MYSIIWLAILGRFSGDLYRPVDYVLNMITVFLFHGMPYYLLIIGFRCVDQGKISFKNRHLHSEYTKNI